ncbi:MAG: DNA replication and repair protein RecF, partial [Flammeovirgaceae bacterium]|nr:DNA replication and repair protein RecF [Flammeovirgaceae bacterium]
KNYLRLLITYQQALQTRNAILKQLNERQQAFDVAVVEPYDIILKEHALKIASIRQQFLQDYVPLVQKHYELLTNGIEKVSLLYQTDCLSEDFNEKFERAFERDVFLQRTTIGIHKDDFLFEMNQYPLKRYGSQGQQKSYLIALKLAQFEISYHKTGTKPLLLLDDIFDKLDDKRIGQLLALLYRQPLGQVFITDARPERSLQFFSTTHVQLIDVEELHKDSQKPLYL